MSSEDILRVCGNGVYEVILAGVLTVPDSLPGVTSICHHADDVYHRTALWF
jgi:hypothetical protein